MALTKTTKRLLNEYFKTQPALNKPGVPAAKSGILLGDIIDSALVGIKPGLDAVTKALLNAFPRTQPALNRTALPASKSAILLGDILDAALKKGSAGKAGCAYVSSEVGPWTVTVAAVAHGLADGATTTVSAGTDPDVDGPHVIHKITDDSFSFVSLADPSASGTLDFTAVPPVVGAAYTSAPTSWLVTVTSAAHSISNGVSVTVSAATDAALDGAHTITISGPDAFVFGAAALPSPGTLTWAAVTTGMTLAASDKKLLNDFSKTQPALQAPGVPAAKSGILLGDLIEQALL